MKFVLVRGLQNLKYIRKKQKLEIIKKTNINLK